MVETEKTDLSRGLAGFDEGLVKASRVMGFQIDKKLIFPGSAVNWAAFDLEKVDTVFRERVKECEKGSGAMSEPHGQGHFVSIERVEFGCSRGGDQKNEASEIFGIVLDILGDDEATVMLRGTGSGDGGERFVTKGESLADAAGGVLRGNALEMGTGGEEVLTLSESHGVRGHGADVLKRRAGTADEVMFDGQNRFRNDGQLAFEQQVINSYDGTRKGVFHGDEKRVGGA